MCDCKRCRNLKFRRSVKWDWTNARRRHGAPRRNTASVQHHLRFAYRADWRGNLQRTNKPRCAGKAEFGQARLRKQVKEAMKMLPVAMP